MTIEKLARFIVADYYQGACGDELFQVAVEREIKKMREYLEMGDSESSCVEVEVER